jgi:hypothetical protein
VELGIVSSWLKSFSRTASAADANSELGFGNYQQLAEVVLPDGFSS